MFTDEQIDVVAEHLRDDWYAEICLMELVAEEGAENE